MTQAVAGTADPRPAEVPARTGARRWAGRGMWALLDQALFSGANWLLLLLLARWWGDQGGRYGAYVLGWQAFMFVAIFHNAVLLDPMLVQGPKRFGDRLGRYLGALLTASVLINVLSVAALLVAAWVYARDGADVGGILAYAAATPVVLLWWVARRGSYLRSSPRPAALAGLGYVALMLAGLAGLHVVGRLTVGVAVAVVATASLVAAVAVAAVEGVRRPDVALLREVVARHWRFGGWSILIGLAMLVPERLYYFVLPLIADDGTRQVGTLQAVHNFILPFLQFNVATCTVLTPAFVRSGRPRLRKLLLGTGLVLTTPALAWAVVATAFAPQVLDVVYGGAFDGSAGLLRVMAWSPVVTAISMTAYPLLASRERVDLFSYAGLAGLVFSLTGGLWLLWRHGLEGASWAIVGSAAMTALASAALAWYVYRGPAFDEPAQETGDA